MPLLVIAALLIFFSPIVISIIALVKVSTLRNELDGLKRWIKNQNLANAQERTREVPKPVPVQETKPIEDRLPEPIKPPPCPIPPKPVEKPLPEKAPEPPKPNMGVEFLMGGRAAAFIGIAVLVVGIALLVGYAIQHEWIGPGMRVMLGLASGLVLVGLGHWVGRIHEKYTIFARVLTGGGSSLFYFTVFAAFAFYHLIGAVMAGVGLSICAAAVFGLAMLYSAQSVAILGVLGAFITPILIGGEMDAGDFPLVYVALINMPVILLGVRRKWQLLYNLAFVFTVIHSLIWMDRLNDRDFIPGICFFVLLYLQFAALGLLKLRHEQKIQGRNIDLARLILSSLFLLGMIYWLFTETGHNDWTGLAFLLLGLLQFAVAGLAYKILARFSGEITALVAGGIFALAMALPVQFDGEWVSLGWGIQGVVLAWFARRVRSSYLQAGAFLLGMLGIMKVLVFDVESYNQPPALFLNARFAVGLISTALIIIQGKLAAQLTDEGEPDVLYDTGWCIGAGGAVLFFFTDVFWTVGPERPDSWLITSLILLVAGSLILLFGPKRQAVIWLGCVMLLAMPFKLLVVDGLIALDEINVTYDPFSNRIIWLQLAMLAISLLLIQPRLAKTRAGFLENTPALPWLMNLSALASGLGLISLEISRMETDWAHVAITILWALSALALILYGMKRRTAPHRYFGLVLFGLATLKVLIVDSSELDGLQRIGAFIGTGILLLILAFAYQKASAFFQSLEDE